MWANEYVLSSAHRHLFVTTLAALGPHPQPSTLHAYCSIERSNLFEQLCALLSKTAFPVSGPVAAVHLQSVDGILAILTALASGCSGVADLGAHMAALAGWLAGWLAVTRPCRQRAHPFAACSGVLLVWLAPWCPLQDFGSHPRSITGSSPACPALPACLPANLLAVADSGSLSQMEDPGEFVDIWSALSTGSHPPLSQVGGRWAARLGVPATAATQSRRWG